MHSGISSILGSCNSKGLQLKLLQYNSKAVEKSTSSTLLLDGRQEKR